MSAFACAPNQGSEEGVGWNWAVEAARLGHEVVVLTQTYEAEAIKRRLTAGDLPACLRFDFMMPRWLERLRRAGLKTGRSSLTHHITHFLWQFAALGHVRRYYNPGDFDIIHHITYAGIRHPTHLGRLPTPLVLGPLGGGDSVPFALRRHIYWSGWLWELLRDIHTYLIRFDPVTRRACADALAIYASTPFSKKALPRRDQHKVSVFSQSGLIAKPRVAPSKRNREKPLHLLFTGRFLYIKGMHLGLRACAAAYRRNIKLKLTMVGSGRDEAEWRRLAASLQIEDLVDWIDWVPHDEIETLYATCDALLFPSLRDSAPFTVLEALAAGKPVICLDTGGASVFVNEDCGRAIPVAGLSESEVVEGLAAAITELAQSPELYDRLAQNAAARVRQYFWPEHVAQFYKDVEMRLARSSSEAGNCGNALPKAIMHPTSSRQTV